MTSALSLMNLAFVVLIGGRSRRFGTDKGLFKINGKSIISYELEILSHFDKSIYIVAHDECQANSYKSILLSDESIAHLFSNNTISFIFDDTSMVNNQDTRTPLLGLYSAFRELNIKGYNKCFVLSCDIPFIKIEVIQLLIEESVEYEGVIPIWENGFLEPLFSIYPVDKGLEQAKENIINRDYKLIKLIREDWNINFLPIESKIKSIDKDLKTFINLNEKMDIKRFNTFMK